MVMSPNSHQQLEPEVSLIVTENKIAMNRAREDSLVSATTDVSSPIKSPDEVKPEDDDDGFGEFLSLLGSKDGLDDSPPDNDAPTSPRSEKNVVADDPAETGHAKADEVPAGDEKNEDTPSSGDQDGSPEQDTPTPADGEAESPANNAEVGTGAAGADEKNEDGPPNQERRKSSELKIKLHGKNMLDSVNTVDSWGGKAGSLPPLGDGPQRSTMPEFTTTSANLLDVSDLDDDLENGSSPQDKNTDKRSKSMSQIKGAPKDDDDDDAASYVNVNKLMQPGSSQYYYSKANRSNRQLLEKVKSKKKLNRGVSLDESHHSRTSYLSERSRLSAYRGPRPLMKDGSYIKSSMRVSRTSSNMSTYLSLGSMAYPVEEDDGEANAGTLKRCSFSCVDIREHERIAGDNPCVSSGVPLSIGWGYYQHDSISLDDYELNKGQPRDKIEMMVPAGVRKQMLRDEFGVSIAEMNAAMREVNVTKRQRRHTVATEHMEGWSEVLQSAKRKFKRFVARTSTAKEEEKIWEEAHKTAMGEYLKKHGSGSLGKNPESAGVGGINQGPKIVPESNGNGGGSAPFLEISFQNGNGEGGAPTF